MPAPSAWEQLVSEARRAVRAVADEESAAQAEQLRVAIARAQADSLSAYVSEERGSPTSAAVSSRCASASSPTGWPSSSRLSSNGSKSGSARWESDLERAQNALQGSVATLEQRMRQRIADVESRVASESDELDPTIDEQRAAAVRLREELETSARDALARSLEEVQLQADDRRRTIDELNERLRQHEHAVTEQVDHAESRGPHAHRARIRRARATPGGACRARDRSRDRLPERGGLPSSSRTGCVPSARKPADRLREELDRIAESFLRRADGLHRRRVAAGRHQGVAADRRPAHRARAPVRGAERTA